MKIIRKMAEDGRVALRHVRRDAMEQIKKHAHDSGTTEGAVKAVTRLIDTDKVQIMLGSQLSGNLQATGAQVEAAKIPEVGTGVSPVLAVSCGHRREPGITARSRGSSCGARGP